MAVIGAALEVRYSARARDDCSHLVHAIYEKAGFPYRYADSSQLYSGTDDFQLVTRPQPGDLAVWRGHAAIVVNPAQHSFFSATGSGLRVESYDLEYWKHRGPPRFFRYVKSVQQGSPSVTRTASAKPPRLQNADSRLPAGASDPDDLPTSVPQSSAAEALNSLPRTLVVHAPQPKPKQLNEMLPQHFDETGKALLGLDVTKLSDPLIVFDHIEVTGVHVKKNQGWAAVKIDGLHSLVAGRVTRKKRSEEQRWVLTRKDAGTWELLLPLKTAYLQHDFAVRILARQLATLADRTPADSSKDQSQLARTLNLLLER